MSEVYLDSDSKDCFEMISRHFEKEEDTRYSSLWKIVGEKITLYQMCTYRLIEFMDSPTAMPLLKDLVRNAGSEQIHLHSCDNFEQLCEYCNANNSAKIFALPDSKFVAVVFKVEKIQHVTVWSRPKW